MNNRFFFLYWLGECAFCGKAAANGDRTPKNSLPHVLYFSISSFRCLAQASAVLFFP